MFFNLFNKKKKAFICERCKKEITDEESNRIGNHRFCSDCAATPKVNRVPKQVVDNFATTKTIKEDTISDVLQKEAKEAGYQAYMDYAKGSLTPEEAYLNRGFVKDKDGKWVYGKLVTINDTIKSNTNEKEQQEIITAELFELVSKYNEMKTDKIDLDNIFIGKCVNKPGGIGCIYRSNGWYLYHVDDRFNLMGQGPFTLNGIIVALSKSLHIPCEFYTRKFNDEEYKLYLSGYKPM